MVSGSDPGRPPQRPGGFGVERPSLDSVAVAEQPDVVGHRWDARSGFLHHRPAARPDRVVPLPRRCEQHPGQGGVPDQELHHQGTVQWKLDVPQIDLQWPVDEVRVDLGEVIGLPKTFDVVEFQSGRAVRECSPGHFV